MERVDLPSGAWVELRDGSGITERQRRKTRIILQRVSPAGRAALDPENKQDFAEIATADDMAAMYDLNDAIVVELVAAWSFDIPIPPTADDLQELPGPDYDALLTAAAPHIPAFMGVTDFSPSPEPDSPT